MDLSISIISYNTKNRLQECLTSLFTRTKGLEFEVIVVDNASHDGSLEMVKRQFPQVTLISNQVNLYFSAAHNQAFGIAKGRHFLVLNSDTKIPEGTLERIVEYLDKNITVGAVGCREVNPQGKTIRTGSTFSSPWLEILERTVLSTIYRLRRPYLNYRMDEWDRLGSRDVDVITDCFIMVRGKIMKQIGGYDEQFLLYYTENDLCLRIWQSGNRVHFRSDCFYTHHGQCSTDQIGAARNRIYDLDMLNYYRKHFGKSSTKLMQVGFILAQLCVAPVLAFYRGLRFGRLNLSKQFS